VADWVRKLAAIDPRIIYLVMGLTVLFPILVPIGLHVTITPPTEAAFDALEKLPEGSRVLVSFDYGPSTSAENDPMAAAILRHCFARNLKVVSIALFPVGGDSVARDQMAAISQEFPDKKDTVDYVNLGYKDGGQAPMKLMATDFRAVFPADAAGRPYESLPIMQDVHSYKDFALGETLATGIIGEWWANLVNAQFHLPIVIGATAVSAPKYYAYLNSGNAVGLLGGLKGASEYEKLLIEKYPQFEPAYKQAGVLTAMKGMDAQNIAHLAIVFFIIVGNVFYIVMRRSRRAGGAA